jgi:excisionase family DNA binding protein
MTVAEAAKRLEVSPGTVYLLCSTRQLGHFRVGGGRGVIRISEWDVAEYETRRRVSPLPPVSEPTPARRSQRRRSQGVEIPDLADIARRIKRGVSPARPPREGGRSGH